MSSDPKPPFFLLGKYPGTPQTSKLPWATLYHVSQTYGTTDGKDVERGIDIATPFPYYTKVDTGYPIIAAFSGIVTDWAYLDCPGGVISTDCVFPINSFNQTNAVYYQHIDLFNPEVLHVGYQVIAGETVLGWSGGQLHGGHHPNQRACSTGPHVEFGINPPYGRPWNPNNHFPSVDPLPYLVAAATTGVTGNFLGFTTAPGFLPLAQRLDDALHIHALDTTGKGLDRIGNMGGSAMRNIEPLALRGLIAMFGVVILAGVMWNLLRPAAEQLLSVADTAAEDAAKLGVAAAA